MELCFEPCVFLSQPEVVLLERILHGEQLVDFMFKLGHALKLAGTRPTRGLGVSGAFDKDCVCSVGRVVLWQKSG